MKRLLLATRNAHKKTEIGDLLKGLPIEVVGTDSFAAMPETVEDQPTLEGNAAKKARECASFSGLWSLADDTGLEVRALDGAPGVYSARYAGPGCTYADNNKKLLAAMQGKADRFAQFRTVMALCSPEGEITLEQGILRGTVAADGRGVNGFGYDPIFIVDGTDKTLAELALEEKNKISHRARALSNILPHVRRMLVLVALALGVCASNAKATRTEPGQETIWDQIMASQAHRELRLGAQYIDAKQYDAALKELQRAVQANPKDATAQMMLGVAYYWTGEVDKSMECYRTSLELEPANPQSYMLLGISQAYKGQVNEAYASFKKSAELDPTRADIQMNLGSIEDSMNRTLDSLEHFRKAVQLAPHEALYHYQLGMLYRRLGRDAEAADSLREALKDFPQFEDAMLELGAIEERAGDRKAATKDFKKAVETKPLDSVARFRLARLYLKDNDHKRAREVLGDAFHLTPEEGGPGLQLSVSYAGGKRQDAGPDGSGKTAPPKPEGDPNDPLNVFKRNLDRVPLDQNALMQVDVMFVPKPKLVKKGPGEVSTLGKALKKDFGDRPQIKAVRREFHIDAADGPARERQISQVMDELRREMEQAPADADVRLGMNLNFTKAAHTAAGTGGGAGSGRGDAQTQPKVSYQPRQVGNDLGLWIMGTGWMSLVEEALPEGSEKPDHPDDADWWVTTGLGYAATGDGQRALGAFERAAELDPGNLLAWLGRGVAAVMTGDEPGATAALERALKVDPKSKPASEGLKWLRRPAASKATATR